MKKLVAVKITDDGAEPIYADVTPMMTDITMRDFFAASAMPFIYKKVKASLEAEGDWEGLTDIEAAVVANESYEMADAMMEARNG